MSDGRGSDRGPVEAATARERADKEYVTELLK
jgi:hypothetical protein